METTMMTRVLKIDPVHPEPEFITQAAEVIRRGGLVAFPTETVYGLGANALNATAVARIFVAKNRPVDDPLIVHLASADLLPLVTRSIPPIVAKLAQTFWPGPLTLILPKMRAVPASVTAGLETVAVRVPDHPVALALLQTCSVPIVAPSANCFGHTSPTIAQHVLADLKDRVDLVLDSGPTTIGVESTVLDVTCMPPLILRPGGVPCDTLERHIGSIAVRSETQATPGLQSSPGLLAKHYAPRAQLILCMGSPAAALEEMIELTHLNHAEGRRVGLLLASEDRVYFDDLAVRIFSLGPSDDLLQIAQNLFAGLRTLDEQGIDVILARDFGERGLGMAISDRLHRAASRVILTF